MGGRHSKTPGKATEPPSGIMIGGRHSKTPEKATELPSGIMPSTSGQQYKTFEDIIIKLAEAISDDSDLRKLGLELGIKASDIDRALATKLAIDVKTRHGNQMILRNWVKTVRPSKQLPTLRAALRKAGLGKLEETCLPSTFPTETNDSVINQLMDESDLFLSHGSFAAYFIALETLGKDVMRKGSVVGETLGVWKPIDASTSSSHAAMSSLSTWQKLPSSAIENVDLDDDSYRRMSAIGASQSKVRKGSVIDKTLGIGKTTDTSISSSHLAAIGLFTLQNLRYLNIMNVGLDDDFYKGMCAASSQSKIERFRHEIRSMAPLGPDASLHYARGLFSMPNLQSLDLTGLELSDEFYSCMATEASKSKIEEFTHEMRSMAPLGPDASLHYARGLFSMPNLQSLNLYQVKLSNEFYSCMATEVSKSKIEEFTHNMYGTAPLGPDASLHYARGLFSMPNLQSLDLTGLNLSDEFYSCMASEASKSKIERFRHVMFSLAPLGPDASLHYARGLFSMPNLRSLDLTGLNLSNEFYSCMAREASKSKIERFTHYMYGTAPLGPDASLHYARGLFSMPNLQSLLVNGLKLSDEFHSSMATEAQKSKVQRLVLKNVSMTRRILHTFLSLPCLQSLTLRGIHNVDKNDKEMLTSKSMSVKELSVDGRDVTTLWKLGLHTSCTQVQKINLQWYYEENVSSEIVTMAGSPFHHLTHLYINGFQATLDSESFSYAVITSCPQLTKLSLVSIDLRNEQATEIIQSMKTHPHLLSLELIRCKTDMGLDPLIAKVDREGKLTVTVMHSRVSQQSKDMPSITAKKTSPSLQVSSSDDLVGATAGIQIHEDETDTQEEEDVEEKKEVEEDYYSATENFPYETDKYNVPPIEMECHKSVGEQGDKLQLDSFGIELEIPPGAVDSKMLQDISLRVLTDTPNLGDSKEEMSVCFGVQCSAPDGMVLKSPVTFTIPHCAIISRPYDIKAVLYCGEGEYTPGAVVKERIELPLSGSPSCIIMKDVLKFRVNHFSWWFFTLSKNESLQGKRLCCLPMVCTKMPVERTPVILHAHLYDDVKGNTEYAIQRWIKEFFSSKESWREDEVKLGYEIVHSETQILIEPSEVDLTVVCSVNNGTPVKEILSYKKICKLSHNCMAFELDLRNQPDRVAVSLKVAQDDDETKLLFYIEFTPYNSDKGSKLGQAKPAGQKDFDEMLKTVAKKIVKGIEIDNLGKALGFDHEAISVYISTNNMGQEVTYEGTLSMLRDWQKRQTKDTECEALKAALLKVDQAHLAHELFGT